MSRPTVLERLNMRWRCLCRAHGIVPELNKQGAPRSRCYRRHDERNARIRALRTDGATYRAIAKAVGLSLVQVHRIATEQRR